MGHCVAAGRGRPRTGLWFRLPADAAQPAPRRAAGTAARRLAVDADRRAAAAACRCAQGERRGQCRHRQRRAALHAALAHAATACDARHAGRRCRLRRRRGPAGSRAPVCGRCGRIPRGTQCAHRRGESGSPCERGAGILQQDIAAACRRAAGARHLGELHGRPARQLSPAAEDADPAIRYFQQVRELALGGAPDPLGLAVASYGEEARIALGQGDLPHAVDLYLEQAARGSASARDSLREVARRLAADADLAVRYIQDPRIQKLWFAQVVAAGFDASWLDRGGSAADGWTARVGRVAAAIDRGQATQLDGLAAVAYATGGFELAASLARGIDAPLAALVRAKLALRAGDRAAAAKEYAAAIGRRSTGGSTGAAGLSDRGWSRLLAENGVLAMSRADYADALQNLLDAGSEYWLDAAHVAERVLSLDELTQFVEQRIPGATPDRIARRCALAQLLGYARQPAAGVAAAAGATADARTALRCGHRELPQQRFRAGWRASQPRGAGRAVRHRHPRQSPQLDACRQGAGHLRGGAVGEAVRHGVAGLRAGAGLLRLRRCDHLGAAGQCRWIPGRGRGEPPRGQRRTGEPALPLPQHRDGARESRRGWAASAITGIRRGAVRRPALGRAVVAAGAGPGVLRAIPARGGRMCSGRRTSAGAARNRTSGAPRPSCGRRGSTRPGLPCGPGRFRWKWRPWRWSPRAWCSPGAGSAGAQPAELSGTDQSAHDPDLPRQACVHLLELRDALAFRRHHLRRRIADEVRIGQLGIGAHDFLLVLFLLLR